jgi:Protein of unknown function (DUF1552)
MYNLGQMFLTRKHLSRRTILRGGGAMIALPFLDSMVPAAASPSNEGPHQRLACIEMVHGAAGSTDEGVQRHYWSPAKQGAEFEWSYSLEPLAPLRDYVTVLSGTQARGAEPARPSESGGDHFRSSAVFLTGAHPKQITGPGVTNGVSIDQLFAQHVAQRSATRVPSLQLCAENIGLSGSCAFEYDCVYSDTISWASPTRPLAMTVNPRAVFDQLFGSTAAGPRASILDGAAEDRSRLQHRVGTTDFTRINAHLEEIRAVERRIQAIEKFNAQAGERERILAPIGVPDSWEDHVRLMFDLQVLAFASDTTRVSTFKMSHDTSLRVFPESGVGAPFHTLSHHSERRELIADFAKINRYHVDQVRYFLERLRATPDGDGNLLDHSLVLYGSPMGDSHLHNHRRLPLFLAGHACGQMRGNLHRQCPDGTPLANVLLTILHKLNVDEARIGDSTGEIDF